jgi:hypothetical protein
MTWGEHRWGWLIALAISLQLVVATESRAQSAVSSDSQASVVRDDDGELDRAEPDVVVVNLPSTMRLALHKGNFRLTHRFAGNLQNGTFRQQASNLFGIDQGAIIGFEYRVEIAPRTQFAFYRSSFEKTIQFHGKYDAIRQRGASPLSVAPLVSIEGTSNFHERYAPAVGAVISRTLGSRVAAYVTPLWVGNTAASLTSIEHSHDDSQVAAAEPSGLPREDTTYVGLGGRVRWGSTSYVAGEVVLRARGYAPGETAFGISVEKRVGSHMFSLTFTNTFGTTYAQLARGGTANSLYLGFNLGRKFV